MVKHFFMSVITICLAFLMTSCSQFALWGGNDTTIYETPTDVTSWMDLDPGETITEMHSGNLHRIYLTSTGRFLAIGSNLTGQFGKSTPKYKDTFIDITSNIGLASGEGVKQFVIGIRAEHNLLLTTNNRLLSWGYNDFGQVGNQTNTDQITPYDLTSSFSLGIGETIEWIAAGESQSLAITSNNRIFTWGNNNYGLLLDGTTTNKNQPTEVTTFQSLLQTGETIVKVTFGGFHVHILTSFGNLYGIGSGYNFALGNADEMQNFLTPILINPTLGLQSGETVSDVMAGWKSAMVITSNNRLISFGGNEFGQAGVGSVELRIQYPTDITSSLNLSTNETVSSISTMGDRFLLLTSLGRLFAWGRGFTLMDFETDLNYINVPTEISYRLGLNAGEVVTLIDDGLSTDNELFLMVKTSQNRMINWQLLMTYEYTYTIANDEVTITSYTGSSQVLYVPDEIDWMPVVAIGDNAFKNNQTLSTITIPESIKSIGNNAFENASNLEEVILENTDTSNITTLGTNAFNNTLSYLKLLVFPTCLTLYQGSTNWSAYASKISGYNSSLAQAVNPPILLTGMNPVYWDDDYNEIVKYTNVQTGTINPNWDETKWYAYLDTFPNRIHPGNIGSSRWANAISSDGSYWVWIPRYIYRVSLGWNESKTGSIDIKFTVGTNDNIHNLPLQTTGTASDSNHTWTSHPAFTFGQQALTGFWVAKFQASEILGEVQSVPAVTPFMTGNLDSKFLRARQMETKASYYGWNSTELDSHLSKSSEWGAISYLSLSVYGRYRTYASTNATLYSTIYNSQNVLAPKTGGSDVLLGSYTDPSWIYNGHQSTTGNAYGVYDMNGGYNEILASVLLPSSNASNPAYGLSILAGNSKYYDTFLTTSALGSLSKGDATYETSGGFGENFAWGGQSSISPTTQNPWFIRGGSLGQLGPGNFCFSGSNGTANDFTTFRMVLVPTP
ncbi:MAG: leucine-rich repeat protein [Firmicutes bacterium]|nr:leucine-rich repeat protein [Bacillota bacterium]